MKDPAERLFDSRPSRAAVFSFPPGGVRLNNLASLSFGFEAAIAAGWGEVGTLAAIIEVADNLLLAKCQQSGARCSTKGDEAEAGMIVRSIYSGTNHFLRA
jgi:hypothetical protein